MHSFSFLLVLFIKIMFYKGLLFEALVEGNRNKYKNLTE